VDLYATRVGAVGAPLDGQGFLVSSGVNRAARAVGGGQQLRLAGGVEDWQRLVDVRPSPGVRSLLVSPAACRGRCRCWSSRSMPPRNACAPAVAWSGQRFLVAFEQPCDQMRGVFPTSPPADVVALWLGSDGTASSAPFTIANRAGAESAPAVAVLPGKGMVLAWRDETSGNSIHMTPSPTAPLRLRRHP